MNSTSSRCDDLQTRIRRRAADLGFARIGFARAGAVCREAAESFGNWIDSGCAAGMEYMKRYREQREDPRLLLEGARTVISAAVAYPAPPRRTEGALGFASYALGTDYHEYVRLMLFQLAEEVRSLAGGEIRVCVDTAPVRERYWAVQAGLGFIGLNNQLILPGLGSRFFLGEVLCTAEFEPDEPCLLSCNGCMACVRACPGGALDGSGRVDARRCHSYLTIEHRGELPDGLLLSDCIYGCDVCQNVCPHNAVAPADHDALVPAALRPRSEMLGITKERLENMTSGDYRRLKSHSAISRVPLKQLLRNLRHIK